MTQAGSIDLLIHIKDISTSPSPSAKFLSLKTERADGQDASVTAGRSGPRIAAPAPSRPRAANLAAVESFAGAGPS
jgi:hypothetical protein